MAPHARGLLDELDTVIVWLGADDDRLEDAVPEEPAPMVTLPIVAPVSKKIACVRSDPLAGLPLV
jgi:hypothetical protein